MANILELSVHFLEQGFEIYRPNLDGKQSLDPFGCVARGPFEILQNSGDSSVIGQCDEILSTFIPDDLFLGVVDGTGFAVIITVDYFSHLRRLLEDLARQIDRDNSPGVFKAITALKALNQLFPFPLPEPCVDQVWREYIGPPSKRLDLKSA